MRSWPGKALAVMLTAGVIVGCAASSAADRGESAGSQTAPRWPDDSAAYASLREMRDKGAVRPAADIAPPAGIDASQLAPLPEDDPARSLAETPLEEALAVCISERPEAPAPPAQPPNEAAVMRARSLYASGAGKLLDRDAPGAARDLAAAARLDPSAPTPWLRLAEAQAAMGQPAAAILSYKRAVDLGAEDATALLLVGLQSDRTGQSAEAAHYLARCLASDPMRGDPLLRNVALVHVAGPLRQKGYLRASMDAVRQGLDMPRRLASPTRFSEEATDIARRASDLWREIGDTACRLGDIPLALEAYERAAGLPSLDPSAVLSRRTYLLLRSGRDAEAALLILDDIASRQGRADGRHLGLLGMLRTDARVGALAASALADLEAALPRPLLPSTASAITLARAAAAAPREARSILAQGLAQAPRDSAIADALFALQESDRSRTELAADLVEQNPSAAEVAATLLLAWHSRPADLPQTLPPTPAGEILRLQCLPRMGMGSAALEGASELPDPRNALALARIKAVGVAAAEQGRWDLVDAVIAALRPTGAAREIAAVCRAAQRYGEGFAALETALREDATVADLLRASELALGAADDAGAEDLLLRAKALDPFDEGAYEGLLTIYQARGDEEKAAATIRELRERVPSGRLLRWVNAQEMARRGMLDESERALRELVEEAPENGNALPLLLQIWQQRSRVGDLDSLDEAAAWLRSSIESPPYSSQLTAALGRVLLMRGDTEGAQRVLTAGMETRPSPVIARSLEEAVRQGGQQARAEEMMLARLGAAGRGIDTSLEHAEVLVELGRIDEAIPHLEDSMPPGATLTALQRGRLVALVSAIAGRAEEAGQASDRAAALDIIRRVGEDGIALPWEVNLTSWLLLAAEDGTSGDDLVAATERLVASVETLEAVKPLLDGSNVPVSHPIETLDEARAQLAYMLALELNRPGSERTDASLTILRAVLRYDPDHAWAANDLGYLLLEQGRDIDEAERLLERAYELLQGEASIVDSLGWLRYKRGQWEDTLLPDGTPRPGAVTLLTTATALPEGDENPTIYDHLGDALWRTGRRERAEAVWLRSQQLWFDRITKLRDGADSPLRAQWTQEAGLVGDKLDSVRAGREPKVAPTLDEGERPPG